MLLRLRNPWIDTSEMRPCRRCAFFLVVIWVDACGIAHYCSETTAPVAVKPKHAVQVAPTHGRRAQRLLFARMDVRVDSVRAGHPCMCGRIVARTGNPPIMDRRYRGKNSAVVPGNPPIMDRRYHGGHSAFLPKHAVQVAPTRGRRAQRLPFAWMDVRADTVGAGGRCMCGRIVARTGNPPIMDRRYRGGVPHSSQAIRRSWIGATTPGIRHSSQAIRRSWIGDTEAGVPQSS